MSSPLRPGIAAIVIVLLTLVVSAQLQAKPLGQFSDQADIGGPKITGEASYEAASKQYDMASSGYNIWYAHDEFHFVWRKLQGDFIFRAHVEFTNEGAEQHRKVGLMARSSLGDSANYVGAQIHGKGPAVLQSRPISGGPTSPLISTGLDGANVVQLERRGNRYVVSVGKEGEPAMKRRAVDIDLGDEIYIGLYLSAHNPDVVAKATFRDVRLTRPDGVEIRLSH